jgi:glycosyltransferase involved in cell wall biosynthesis
MIIAFVHNNKAFLPEVEAYRQFFARYNISCEVVSKDDLGLVHRHIEWRMMGSDLTKPKEGILKIHEYCSTSIPPWRVWKNKSKSFFNAQPDFRLFLNQYVKKTFGFHDRIPFGFRDMGLPAGWLQPTKINPDKEYDFVYIGDLSPFRQPEILLDCFSTGNMKKRSLLVIGKDYHEIKEIYQEYRNIHFTGPVTYLEIPAYLEKARFGINFIIDKEPVNQQTSTKLLDYAACRLPIVTTDYAWIKQFQEQNGGDYFYLRADLSNFTWENVSSFNYTFPDLTEWTWEKQIRKSGVLEFLELKFPEIKFS